MTYDSTENMDRNTLYTDYRPEFVAACIVDSGFETDEVRLIRQGVSKGGKSIERVNREYSRGNMEEYLNIYARKRGLYDSLPEGLFHQRMDIRNRKNKNEVLDSFKKEREIELSARFFFRPFEISIDRMLINVQLYEMHLEKRNKHVDFVRLLSSYWDILRKLPLDKALFVISLLSQCYRLTDAGQIAEVLSVLLGCEVEIRFSYKTMTFGTCESNWNLGSNLLGIDSVIGEQVEDAYPVMEISIKGLRRSQRDLILEGSEANKQFMEILDLFVPADAEISLNADVAKEEGSFFMSDSPSLCPILGFTTIL